MRRTVRIALAFTAVALAACGDDEQKATSGEPTASLEVETVGACKPGDAPATDERTGKKPSGELAAGKTYRLVFDTSCGRFTVTLDPEKAPKTSASLVALAKAHFYDGTAFHRIVPDFVIQGGDPTGRGDGGPGYSTRDEPPAGTRYTKGVVAMAKTGQEPPGTAGSQFFVVTAAEAPFPSPDYAVVGKVTDGLDVVERIGGLGGPDERPIQPVVIDKVTAEESG